VNFARAVDRTGLLIPIKATKRRGPMGKLDDSLPEAPAQEPTRLPVTRAPLLHKVGD
jgi:hypothetical protein